MLTSVRYSHEPGAFAWQIPFPFECDSQVGVNLIDAAGLERPLTLGADYQVSGQSLIYVLPEGHSLVIYLNAPVAQVQAVANGRALAQQTLTQAQPAPQAEPVAETAASAADSATQSQLEELAAQIRKLQDEREQALVLARAAEQDSQLKAVAESGQAALSSITEAGSEALESVQAAREEVTGELAAAYLDAQSVSSQLQDVAAQAQAAASQLDVKTASSLASLEARLSQLEDRLNAAASKEEARLSQAAAQGQNQIGAAAARAAREAEARSCLCGEAWPQSASQVLTEDVAVGSVLPLPNYLRYYPGRKSLHIFLNGFYLTPDKDFQEVGQAEADSWRSLRALKAGDALAFVIAPTNAGQAASLSAAEARRHASDASQSAARAHSDVLAIQSISDRTITEGTARLNAIAKEGSQAVRNVTLAGKNAVTEIQSTALAGRKDCVKVWEKAAADIRKEGQSSGDAARLLWQQAQKDVANARADAMEKAESLKASADNAASRAAKSAGSSQSLAECAWRAAYQASIDRAWPGIGGVACYEDLAYRPAGFYVINPLLKASLPFMGIFPVKSLADAVGHDGIFLVGAQLWPEDMPVPDVPYPENPDNVPDMRPPAMNNNWLPCDHHHPRQEAPCN